MSWIDKCLGKTWSYIVRESPFSRATVSGTTSSGREKKEPTLTSTTKEEPPLSGEAKEEPTAPDQTRCEPVPTGAKWCAIEKKFKAKVQAIVPKTVVESLHDSRVANAWLDFDAIQQAAVNRLFADALYHILKTQAEPPFDPSEQMLRWAEAALEETVQAWRESGKVGSELGEGRSTMVDAIAASLKRASANDVLKKAATRRIEEERAASGDG